MKINKKIYILLITILSFLSCVNKIENEDWKKTVNNNNFNDYLSFCLKYPNSEKFQKSIDLYFDERDKYWDKHPPPPFDCFSSCGYIEVGTNNGKLLFEHELVNIDTLDNLLYKFLLNENNKSEWPSKINLTDKDGVSRLISKGVFEISFDKHHIEALKPVFNIINKTFNNYREYLSNQFYSESFSNIDNKKKENIESLVTTRIILWYARYDIPLPPPPPKIPLKKNDSL